MLTLQSDHRDSWQHLQYCNNFGFISLAKLITQIWNDNKSISQIRSLQQENITESNSSLYLTWFNFLSKLFFFFLLHSKCGWHKER